jgi:hypothetical protein
MNDILGKFKGIASIMLAAGLAVSVAQAQTTPPALPAGVQDVVKLTQAGLSEDVILSQVKNAGASYNLSTDQLIYLSKSGVSQNVIKALMTTGASSAAVAPAPVAVPVAPSAPIAQPAPTYVAPPPGAPPVAGPATVVTPGVNYDSFHTQLAPYGTWVEEPGYGPCWRPTVAAFDLNWHPYGDEGHWVYTDEGWYWQSDYPWGGVAFHYGRWFRDSVGWVWLPGYDYAPAWVSWRRGDTYCGWAPLPPGAVFRAGVGLEFGGRLAVDADFGLGVGAFVFVGYDHFWDHNLRGFFWPHDRAEFAFRHAVVLNGYHFDHGRFMVEGLGRDHIARYTHRDVRVEAPGIHVGIGFGDHGGDHGDHGGRGFHDDRHDH